MIEMDRNVICMKTSLVENVQSISDNEETNRAPLFEYMLLISRVYSTINSVRKIYTTAMLLQQFLSLTIGF